jgi:hypothetical protein
MPKSLARDNLFYFLFFWWPVLPPSLPQELVNPKFDTSSLPSDPPSSWRMPVPGTPMPPLPPRPTQPPTTTAATPSASTASSSSPPAASSPGLAASASASASAAAPTSTHKPAAAANSGAPPSTATSAGVAASPAASTEAKVSTLGRWEPLFLLGNLFILLASVLYLLPLFDNGQQFYQALSGTAAVLYFISLMRRQGVRGL